MSSNASVVLTNPDQEIISSPKGMNLSVNAFTGKKSNPWYLGSSKYIELKLTIAQDQSADLHFALQLTQDTTYKVTLNKSELTESNSTSEQPEFEDAVEVIQSTAVSPVGLTFTQVELSAGDNLIRLTKLSGAKVLSIESITIKLHDEEEAGEEEEGGPDARSEAFWTERRQRIGAVDADSKEADAAELAQHYQQQRDEYRRRLRQQLGLELGGDDHDG